jgi:hypothetical protein
MLQGGMMNCVLQGRMMEFILQGWVVGGGATVAVEK